jgi:hypothetical protein
MEIYLDKRAVKQIRLSAQDAIEEGSGRTSSRRSPRSRSRRSSAASTTGTSSSF